LEPYKQLYYNILIYRTPLKMNVWVQKKERKTNF